VTSLPVEVKRAAWSQAQLVTSSAFVKTDQSMKK